MLGRLLSLLVDEDNHRLSQKAASPIPGLVASAGLEQMVVTVLVLFLIEAAEGRLLGLGMTAAISLTLASW